jgi:hypothetical protein
MIVVYTSIVLTTCKIFFCGVVILPVCESERFGAALLTLSVVRTDLLEQRPQTRQFSTTEAGNDVTLRCAPIGQSAQESRLAFLRQRDFAFAQITARGKRKQPPLGETLDVASDGGGIAI